MTPCAPRSSPCCCRLSAWPATEGGVLTVSCEGNGITEAEWLVRVESAVRHLDEVDVIDAGGLRVLEQLLGGEGGRLHVRLLEPPGEGVVGDVRRPDSSVRVDVSHARCLLCGCVASHEAFYGPQARAAPTT